MRRRQVIQGLMAIPWVWPLNSLAQSVESLGTKRRIVVVGAGAFGGWTALQLARAGADVTLVEAWDPGHPRSSSGGETRVIRQMYGNGLYARMAGRSLSLFAQAEHDWGESLLHRTGVLFMAQADGSEVFDAGVEVLRQENIEFESLDPDALAARWPQIALDGIEQAAYEPQSGYLLARRACHAVIEAFRRAGGRVVTARALPGPMQAERMQALRLHDGTSIAADAFVFACGPWLPSLFPELVGPILTTSRQEVHYFGTPAGDRAHDETRLPVWADFGARLWYGIPGSERRGFKIADDSRGEPIDPERAERIPSPQGIAAARDYLAERFPRLADAPLIDARVCQYTNTTNGDFLVDRHPEARNVWLVGGGSGHGYKHGPALGELVAESVLGETVVEPTFSFEAHRSA